MIDLSSLVPILQSLVHNLKLVALTTLAFYIAGDAVITMIRAHKFFNWAYATQYIGKFSEVYLGLVVMAVMGQYVPAVDAVFWLSVSIYTKSELDDLLKKFSSAPGPVAPGLA